MYLTKEETIKRLCALASEVGASFEPTELHDCFCGNNPLAEKFLDDYKMSEVVILFIEDAVKEKLENE